MKKFIPFIIALLLIFTACTQAVPNNGSSDVPSSTPSSNSSASSGSNINKSLKTLLIENDFATIFKKSEYGYNSGVSHSLNFNEEAFGSLKIENVSVTSVNITDKDKYYYKGTQGAYYFDNPKGYVLKNVLLGGRHGDYSLTKISFTVTDSGNTDLPLGDVVRYKTPYGGGEYGGDAFLEFIDEYHNGITDADAMIDSPLSRAGIAIINLFNHFGAKEFNGFDNSVHTEIISSLPKDIHGEVTYVGFNYDSVTDKLYKGFNDHVETMFGIENYFTKEGNALYYGGEAVPKIDYKEWKYEDIYNEERDIYLFETEGLALSGFTRDGDNLYLDFTSYIDNLGFFLNYRYRITLRLLPETDENGLRYVRIVSGEFLEE